MTANEAREYAERYVILGEYWNMCGMPAGDIIDIIHTTEENLMNGDFDYIIEWLEKTLEDPTEDDWFDNEVKELFDILKHERM